MRGPVTTVTGDEGAFIIRSMSAPLCNASAVMTALGGSLLCPGLVVTCGDLWLVAHRPGNSSSFSSLRNSN